MDYRKVSIETLNNGAVIDLFEEAWDQVMENIADPNVKAEDMRQITLTIKVKPGKDRSSAATICDVKVKLAQVQANESFVALDKTGKKVEAYTTDPKQQDLPIGENIMQMGGSNG